MSKNYQEKYKAHLDDMLRGKREPVTKQEGSNSKLDRLIRYTCTLDIDDKKDESSEKK